MLGTNSTTGKALSGFEHLTQSVVDILTTRIYSRVWVRNYGSNLPALVDAPMNAETISRIIYEAAIALILWEPRFDLQRVVCQSVTAGKIVLTLIGIYKPEGTQVTLDGIVIS